MKTFCELLNCFIPEQSRPDLNGLQNENLKNLLEKARDIAPENQQNIKIAFAEGYLAANTENKDNSSGPGKVMKVFIFIIQCLMVSDDQYGFFI